MYEAESLTEAFFLSHKKRQTVPPGAFTKIEISQRLRVHEVIAILLVFQ